MNTSTTNNGEGSDTRTFHYTVKVYQRTLYHAFHIDTLSLKIIGINPIIADIYNAVSQMYGDRIIDICTDITRTIVLGDEILPFNIELDGCLIENDGEVCVYIRDQPSVPLSDVYNRFKEYVRENYMNLSSEYRLVQSSFGAISPSLRNGVGLFGGVGGRESNGAVDINREIEVAGSPPGGPSGVSYGSSSGLTTPSSSSIGINPWLRPPYSYQNSPFENARQQTRIGPTTVSVSSYTTSASSLSSRLGFTSMVDFLSNTEAIENLFDEMPSMQQPSTPMNQGNMNNDGINDFAQRYNRYFENIMGHQTGGSGLGTGPSMFTYRFNPTQNTGNSNGSTNIMGESFLSSFQNSIFRTLMRNIGGMNEYGEDVKVTLSKDQLDNIPNVEFNSDEHHPNNCAICLEDFEEGEKVKLLKCKHPYHEQCVSEWLNKNSTKCPICRTEVDKGTPNIDVESSESSTTIGSNPMGIHGNTIWNFTVNNNIINNTTNVTTNNITNHINNYNHMNDYNDDDNDNEENVVDGINMNQTYTDPFDIFGVGLNDLVNYNGYDNGYDEEVELNILIIHPPISEQTEDSSNESVELQRTPDQEHSESLGEEQNSNSNDSG